MGSFNLAENTEIHKNKSNKQKEQTEAYMHAQSLRHV